MKFILQYATRDSIAGAYTSFNEKTGYTMRTVYVIDKNGYIVYTCCLYSVRDNSSFSNLQDFLKTLP